MTQRLWVFLVLGFLSVHAAHSAEVDLAQVESALIAERKNIEARAAFIPASLLDQLYYVSPSELSSAASRSGVSEKRLRMALEKIQSMAKFRQELASKNLLLESGCLLARRPGWEVNLLATPGGERLTFDEILEKAYGAFVVEVTEIRSGFYLGLGTRVVARIQEVLGETRLRLRPGDRVEYFQGYFSIRVGDFELCAERPGFERERLGDRVLLLAATPTSHQGPEALVPSLTIPIVGQTLALPPYRELVPADAIDLETLRALIDSHGCCGD